MRASSVPSSLRCPGVSEASLFYGLLWRKCCQSTWDRPHLYNMVFFQLESTEYLPVVLWNRTILASQKKNCFWSHCRGTWGKTFMMSRLDASGIHPSRECPSVTAWLSWAPMAPVHSSWEGHPTPSSLLFCTYYRGLTLRAHRFYSNL